MLKKFGIVAAFDLKPKEGEENIGFMAALKGMAAKVSVMLKEGIVSAFSLENEGVKDVEQSWGDIATGVMDKILTTLRENDFSGQIRGLFIQAFNLRQRRW